MEDKFEENGFVIFNIEDPDLVAQVNEDVEKIIECADFRTNSKIYSYNDAPRIVESHKRSLACEKLAKHPKVIETLETLYADVPLPFSTINFTRTTQQPLHSDYAHFGTVPELLLAGSWVALEDIHPNAGPLQIVPGSHKMDIFEFSQVAEKKPTTLNDVKSQYSLYENWVTTFIEDNNLEIITPSMKAGDCIIWAANLLHGSPDCVDNTLSRRSQVTHWTFSKTKSHYNPYFSVPSQKQYVERSVNYF